MPPCQVASEDIALVYDSYQARSAVKWESVGGENAQEGRMRG
jgi:hypothetical protein